jgi:hypothetical protein
MALEDVPDRFVVIAIGILVLLAPAVLLAMTVGLLVSTGDLILEEVTLLVFLELYLLEIVVFAAFSYGLYRLMKVLVVHRLPASLSALEEESTDDEAVDTRD